MLYRYCIINQHIATKASNINGWEYLVVILYVSFYEVADDGIGVGMLGMIQTVTIPLLIHYCILSTTYSTNNYNVNNSNKSYRIMGNNCKLSEINKNNCNIPVVFVLDVVYTTISFTKRGSKYENG